MIASLESNPNLAYVISAFSFLHTKKVEGMSFPGLVLSVSNGGSEDLASSHFSALLSLVCSLSLHPSALVVSL